MSEEEPELTSDQLRAIGAMSGAIAADLDELEPEAVVEWLKRNPRSTSPVD